MNLFNAFLFSTLFLTACSNQSEADKLGDQYYTKFKDAIAKDSLSAFASSDAQNVLVYSSDSSKVREARAWLKKLNGYLQQYDDSSRRNAEKNSIFLSHTFKVLKILEAEPGCNRLTARYLVSAKTYNKDSILEAMKIFTDSVFSSIRYDATCGKKKCILTIFDNVSDFKSNSWLALGTRLMGEEAKVQYSYFR
jgi:hypothetical protein